MEPIGDVVFREYVPYEELPRYHRSAHVFCAPNTGNESQGYVLLEAMAAGMPVVASNIEGFAGVITDELDGILVKPKDSDALALAIVRLLRDPVRRAEVARRGQAQAAHYSWDNIARRVLSYYERLLYEHEQVAAATAARRLPIVAQ
jgi:phosphatidylinositol alpha-mannosyltransferase